MNKRPLVLALSLFIFSLIASPCIAAEPLTVTRCIDGDTLQLSNGEKVRLIGVDTPESKNNAKARKDAGRVGDTTETIIKMGKESVEFTRKLVEGKQVRLEYDVQKKDKYGRTLAYLYLEDGTFVNAELIKAGYAQIMTVPPNVKQQELFLKLQKEARVIVAPENWTIK